MPLPLPRQTASASQVSKCTPAPTVNTEVIVLEWDLPKISGTDLLVKRRRQFARIGTVFSWHAQRSAGTRVDS